VTKLVEVTFVDEGIAARFMLHEKEAPLTTSAIWTALGGPLEGGSGHGQVSGTCVGFRLDSSIIIPAENCTGYVQTGDVLYTHYDASWRFGYPDAVSELYWAYDRFVRPIVPGLGIPAVANVVGQFVGDCTAFYALCRRTGKEGSKRLRLSRLSE